MVPTKHHRGYIRPMRGYSQASQVAAVEPLAATTYVEGVDGATLDAAIRSLRKGDVLVVHWLHLLAAPRTKTSDKPRQSLWQAIQRIEGKGATIMEVGSGRHSAVFAERDAMIADAIEVLSKAGRAMTTERARKIGSLGGRPPKEFTDAQVEQARRAWFDLRHATNDAAIAASPKGWAMTRSYRMFGPSGRTKH